jgi:hypothetical protein
LAEHGALGEIAGQGWIDGEPARVDKDVTLMEILQVAAV